MDYTRREGEVREIHTRWGRKVDRSAGIIGARGEWFFGDVLIRESTLSSVVSGKELREGGEYKEDESHYKDWLEIDAQTLSILARN